MANPTLVSLGSLRSSVRQRADMVNSTFVTDSELNGYINDSYAELYDLLVQKYGDNYYVGNPLPPYTFQTDGINQFFQLPDDFYKLLGVDLALANSTDSFITLTNFQFGDRNRYSVPNFQSFYGVTNLRYRIHGNNPSYIWLTPVPSGGQTIRIWYVPKITYLVLDADMMDGVSGWEEYVIIDAAMKALIKEETDVSAFMAQKAAMLARIESAAENRDAGKPPKVTDAQYNDFWWPTGSGNGDGSGAY